MSTADRWAINDLVARFDDAVNRRDAAYGRMGGRRLFAARRYVYLWLNKATVGGAPIPHGAVA